VGKGLVGVANLAGSTDGKYGRPLATCFTRALFWPFGFVNLAILVVSVMAPLEIGVRILLALVSAALIVFAMRLELRTGVHFQQASIEVGNAFSRRTVRASDVGMVYCGRISNGQVGPSLPGLALALSDGTILHVQCSIGNSIKNRRSIHDEALRWTRRNKVRASIPDMGPLATWKMSPPSVRRV
jgi:hypothetical protein